MKKMLVVVDMQVDFVNGALGTPEAQAIVEPVRARIQQARQEGEQVVFTLDTHRENYSDTQERRKPLVPHCIKGTPGWQLVPELRELARDCVQLPKPTFGSMALARLAEREQVEEVELIGLCTDICVISNALLLKAALPEVPISVDASCCAGVTPESHANALAAMRVCQVKIRGEEKEA